MSMFQECPLPWRVNGSERSTAIWVEDADGKRVCIVRNHERDSDVARLMAAAPDMLDALKVAANVLFLLSDEVAALGLKAENVAPKVRAAITKTEAA